MYLNKLDIQHIEMSTIGVLMQDHCAVLEKQTHQRYRVLYSAQEKYIRYDAHALSSAPRIMESESRHPRGLRHHRDDALLNADAVPEDLCS